VIQGAATPQPVSSPANVSAGKALHGVLVEARQVRHAPISKGRISSIICLIGCEKRSCVIAIFACWVGYTPFDTAPQTINSEPTSS